MKILLDIKFVGVIIARQKRIRVLLVQQEYQN
jgi:hypothetical protein